MKFIRKHGPIALGILALVVVLGLVGELPEERDATTAHVSETIAAAREEALVKHRADEWQHILDWSQQFVPAAPQIALK